jgi:dolichol-phosphate mannosyltransferase
MLNISFIVPAHNEDENIQCLVEQLILTCRQWYFSYEVLIVDDHSTDHTLELSEKLARRYDNVFLVKNTSAHRGMGSALQYGAGKAQGRFICWLMADMSDDLMLIEPMRQELIKGTDLVIASRYMGSDIKAGRPKWKIFLSRHYSVFARIWFGFHVHDITNAYRMFKKDMLNGLKLNATSFAISPEMAIKAHLCGFIIAEKQATYQGRVHGRSKFRIIMEIWNYSRLFLLKFRKNRFPPVCKCDVS